MGKKSFINAMVERVDTTGKEAIYEFEGGDKIPETKCFLTMEELFKNK